MFLINPQYTYIAVTWSNIWSVDQLWDIFRFAADLFTRAVAKLQGRTESNAKRILYKHQHQQLVMINSINHVYYSTVLMSKLRYFIDDNILQPQ